MRTHKVWRVAMAAGIVAMSLAAPATGAPSGTKVLGTDAENDAPPGGDLKALEVAQDGRDLNIRIVMTMIPSVGSYPQAGIQWSFMSRSRMFAVEAHQENPGEYGFTLYEIKGSTFNVVDSIDGELEDGAFSMYVPLTAISATKGTVIKGMALPGAGGDVEIHQHAQVTSQIVDEFQTTKPFKVR